MKKLQPLKRHFLIPIFFYRQFASSLHIYINQHSQTDFYLLQRTPSFYQGGLSLICYCVSVLFFFLLVSSRTTPSHAISLIFLKGIFPLTFLAYLLKEPASSSVFLNFFIGIIYIISVLIYNHRLSSRTVLERGLPFIWFYHRFHQWQIYLKCSPFV